MHSIFATISTPFPTELIFFGVALTVIYLSSRIGTRTLAGRSALTHAAFVTGSTLTVSTAAWLQGRTSLALQLPTLVAAMSATVGAGVFVAAGARQSGSPLGREWLMLLVAAAAFFAAGKVGSLDWITSAALGALGLAIVQASVHPDSKDESLGEATPERNGPLLTAVAAVIVAGAGAALLAGVLPGLDKRFLGGSESTAALLLSLFLVAPSVLDSVRHAGTQAGRSVAASIPLSAAGCMLAVMPLLSLFGWIRSTIDSNPTAVSIEIPTESANIDAAIVLAAAVLIAPAAAGLWRARRTEAGVLLVLAMTLLMLRAAALPR